MANEGGSVDDDAEGSNNNDGGVIGAVSDVADEDAAAGNGAFGGGANVGIDVGVVGINVGDAVAAGKSFFAGGAGNGLLTSGRDVTGVGLDTAAAACAFALGFRRGRLEGFGRADSVVTHCDVDFSMSRPISQ